VSHARHARARVKALYPAQLAVVELVVAHIANRLVRCISDEVEDAVGVRIDGPERLRGER
jgi:hypothetical protein